MEETTRGCATAKRPSIFDLMVAVDIKTRQLAKPLPPVAPGEVVVGVLSEGLRRLMFVVEDLRKEGRARAEQLQQRAIELDGAHNALHESAEAEGEELPQEVCDAHHAAMDEIERQFNAANMVGRKASQGVFWQMAQLEHPEIIGKDIGVRDGFQLVILLPEEEPSASQRPDLSRLNMLAAFLSGGAPRVSLGEDGHYQIAES